MMDESVECPDCDGRGHEFIETSNDRLISKVECLLCSGTGTVSKSLARLRRGVELTRARMEMDWVLLVREIADADRRPTGRYRLTAKSELDNGHPVAMCYCQDGHDSVISARNCPLARLKAQDYGA
jgi:uncharacterized DUF497 family protein